jgi:hypothetical protein
MQSNVPERRPILVPEGGPANPLFERVEGGDVIEATVLFRGSLPEAELDEAERAVTAWFAGAEWGGRMPTLVEETLTSTCLHVAVTGVRTARSALELLLRTLLALGVPMRRAVFARRRADGDRDALVRGMDPTARPEVEYDDAGAWWQACFDAGAPPPMSEDRAELAQDDDALLEMGKTTYAERRGLPLHVPGVRICYGLGAALGSDDDGVPTRSGADVSRGEEIARALQGALAERFVGGDEALSRPVHENRYHAPDAPLDRILAGGRAGYSCSFRARDLREFLHDHHYRYREYELMLALRDVARAMDLEPVVCWRRQEGRYVVQLWERSASRVHVAA